MVSPHRLRGNLVYTGLVPKLLGHSFADICSAGSVRGGTPKTFDPVCSDDVDPKVLA
jgi:hypothetical protein